MTFYLSKQAIALVNFLKLTQVLQVMQALGFLL
jgi:hypothetical protein